MILCDGQRTFCAEAVIGFLTVALMEPHMSPISRVMTGRNYTNLFLFHFIFRNVKVSDIGYRKSVSGDDRR